MWTREYGRFGALKCDRLAEVSGLTEWPVVTDFGNGRLVSSESE